MTTLGRADILRRESPRSAPPMWSAAAGRRFVTAPLAGPCSTRKKRHSSCTSRPRSRTDVNRAIPLADGCPPLDFPGLASPTSCAPRSSAVGASQDSPARKGWVPKHKALSTVGAAHSDPRASTPNLDVDKATVHAAWATDHTISNRQLETIRNRRNPPRFSKLAFSNKIIYLMQVMAVSYYEAAPFSTLASEIYTAGAGKARDDDSDRPAV